MKTFATLVHALDSTNKTTQKLAAIERFLTEATEQDKIWLLALFTGKRPKRPVTTTLLKQWAMEVTRVPEWLFQECYAAVGDLGETIALLLPDPETIRERTLSEWMDLIAQLKDKPDDEKKTFVLRAWHELSLVERFIFNKLIGGSFRLGISSQSLINALARHYELETNAITHSIMGDWQIGSVGFDKLIRGEYTNTQLSKPYPFCLAYALDKDPADLGQIDDWQAEYKWDGIRGQFIKRKNEIFIWSRGEELITTQFPEIRESLLLIPGDFVIDGELLVIKDQQVQNFSELQKRLNRKNVSRKMQQDYPVSVFAYDLLELNSIDLRDKPLHDRRARLEHLLSHPNGGNFIISGRLPVDNWEGLKDLRETSRNNNSEGLMLKNLYSPYHTGRKRGDWWKWKIEPLTIDAVLIYAQKGSGRRSGYYTDYTFAVKDGDTLVTIAKAYSGLTDKEIQEVSRFVNKQATEKFGPVRTVKPELVFEIAFEGIGFSSRHRSGVALRFPRISRWRKDKTVAEIDTLDEIKKLIR
jgi:DNA ligase-1